VLRVVALCQVDNRHTSEPIITPEQAVKLCDRNFGVGGDGVGSLTIYINYGTQVLASNCRSGSRSGSRSSLLPWKGYQLVCSVLYIPVTLCLSISLPADAYACNQQKLLLPFIFAVCLPPQVIFALPPVGETDLTMRIFNSDGSEPEMCGNGIRCLARFVADVDGKTELKYKIHTLAGEFGVSFHF
jgi:hypothetical protein